MTDSSQTIQPDTCQGTEVKQEIEQVIHNQRDPNVKQENVEPIYAVEQEIHYWDGHGSYPAPPFFPDISILHRIYDELLLSKEQNRLLEQRMASIEELAKERAAKEKSVLDLAQEAVDCACHYLGEAVQTVNSQKDAMDQWKNGNDDRLEDICKENREALKDLNEELKNLKSGLNKFGGIVETAAKNSTTNNEMYSTTLTEMQRQMNYITEFLPNNYTGNMQQISEMLMINNTETNKNMTDQLTKFSEANFSGLRKVRVQLNQFGEALEKSGNKENELKTLEEQIGKIQSKLEDIQKQNGNVSKSVPNLPNADFKKIKDMFLELMGYCKNRVTDNNKMMNNESLIVNNALTQLTNQITKLAEKLDYQKDPSAALEKMQDQLKRIKELLKENDDDKTGGNAAEKEACLFCKYTDHYSEDCHVFPTTGSRATKLYEVGICGKCLKPRTQCSYGTCPNFVCQPCFAQYGGLPALYNHHPIVCTSKKNEEPEAKKRRK